MLRAGLDLNRNCIDVCLLSDQGEIVEAASRNSIGRPHHHDASQPIALSPGSALNLYRPDPQLTASLRRLRESIRSVSLSFPAPPLRQSAPSLPESRSSPGAPGSADAFVTDDTHGYGMAESCVGKTISPKPALCGDSGWTTRPARSRD